jgi:hypothetical protein
MAGYWQRPDETAKVMTADGFFRTGDIGVVDERGFFKIVDRKKDMILVSGFNVYPNEVEDVVTQMPGVLECAAVGVPDDKAGEAVKLVIVKEDPVTEADVKRLLRGDNLTGYKRPRIVEFRTDLPKTPVGKILRRELRDAAAAHRAGHAVHRGLVVSGDRFVSTSAESAALRGLLPDALAVEMEGAAVAQVCHDFGRAFAVMRTISDRADDAAHVDFPRFVANVASGLTRRIVAHALA